MADYSSKNTSDMIYSPKYHIPIGQAIRLENGDYGLRVKKDKSTFEVVSIGNLMSQIVKIADKKV